MNDGVNRGTALRLEIRGSGSETRLSATIGTAVKPDFSLPVDPAAVKDLRRGIRDDLTRIHDLVGNFLDVDVSNLLKAVPILLNLASDSTATLIPGHTHELYDRLEQLALRPDDGVLAPRVVEVVAPLFYDFPFELLRWKTRQDGTPQDQLRQILGMSMVVQRRVTPDGFDGSSTSPVVDTAAAHRLDSDPSLPITLFLHPGLASASQGSPASVSESEATYLFRTGGLVDLHGPWPAGTALDERTSATHLLNTRSGLDGQARPRSSSVVHFACHADTKGRRSEIRIGGGSEPITIGTLRRLSGDGLIESEPNRPLVFLNACGTATLELRNRSKLSHFFMGEGFRGFLGTYCDISTAVADHFASVFYEHLLRGRTVGHSAHLARRHLLEMHNNPLGLLYTYNGNPDLRVTSVALDVPPACERGTTARDGRTEDGSLDGPPRH